MPEVGFVIPAHASVLGKVLLAFQPDSHEGPTAPLRSMTGETIIDPERLADHLTEVARTGVVKHDEAVLGDRVAAPIFDATGAAVGAIAIVLQSSEWPPPASRHDDVRLAARTFSRELAPPAGPSTQSTPNPQQAPKRPTPVTSSEHGQASTGETSQRPQALGFASLAQDVYGRGMAI